MEGRCEFYASSTGYAYDNYYNEVSTNYLQYIWKGTHAYEYLLAKHYTMFH